MNQRILTVVLLFSLLAVTDYIFPDSLLAQAGIISDVTFAEEDDFSLDDDWDDDWGIEEEPVLVNDPYEKYNRFMFGVNNKVYKHALVPLSKGYDFLVPKKVQGSINNFVQFASTPKRFFNNLFQKKPKSAVTEFGRLLINASVGIGGLFDPADRVFGLKQQSEDFGQTLAHYGVDSGPYLILPVLGPSTGRDTFGMGVDRAFSPFMWLSQFDVDPETAFTIIRGVKRVNRYSYSARGRYKKIIDTAIEPYTALQSAYIQNRNKHIEE